MHSFCSRFWIRFCLLVLALSTRPFGSLEQEAGSMVDRCSFVPALRLSAGPELHLEVADLGTADEREGGAASERPHSSPWDPTHSLTSGTTPLRPGPVSPYCQRLPYYATAPPPASRIDAGA